MSQASTSDTQKSGTTHHRLFAAYYERTSRSRSERNYMAPLRQEIVGQASGIVLEIGAGNGLNFAFYNPEQVARVEAIEPDTGMLHNARKRAEAAPVPITLTQAAAESLPFADETFDCAVATLVFCSVTDSLAGLREIRRVLKPGGKLLLVEHIRSQGPVIGRIQDMLVPFTTRLAGNCHWNRDTERTIADAGFQIEYRRNLGEGLVPMVMLRATRG
ncbi:MAG TPA: class I SAM-dependent methyltransferase [Ktedonobacteraceae bacterium]|nr:class I SAM-dependent methyltransferase [Ktedonobacteraceae bacterium]